MNGATFFLVVNFVVAMSFGALFVVVARRSQSRKAAMWLGAGFCVASLSALCELLVAYIGPPRIWALGAFATVLCGMVMLTVPSGVRTGTLPPSTASSSEIGNDLIEHYFRQLLVHAPAPAAV